MRAIYVQIHHDHVLVASVQLTSFSRVYQLYLHLLLRSKLLSSHIIQECIVQYMYCYFTSYLIHV